VPDRALGLWPFKDTFYSNSSELTSNPYAGWEDYCRGEHDPKPTGGSSCRYNEGELPATCPNGRGEQMPFSHALIAALGKHCIIYTLYIYKVDLL
jgi:hypothetical protein